MLMYSMRSRDKQDSKYIVMPPARWRTSLFSTNSGELLFSLEWTNDRNVMSSGKRLGALWLARKGTVQKGRHDVMGHWGLRESRYPNSYPNPWQNEHGLKHRSGQIPPRRTPAVGCVATQREV